MLLFIIIKKTKQNKIDIIFRYYKNSKNSELLDVCLITKLMENLFFLCFVLYIASFLM